MLLTITQGITYRPLHFSITGNYMGWLPFGQIRKTAQSGEALADWDFTASTYDTTTNRTYFYAALGASKTALLPVPPQGEAEAVLPESKQNWSKVGRNVWVTDIEIQDASNPESVIQILPLSYVRVIPGVTRSS